MFWKKNKKDDGFGANINSMPPLTPLDAKDFGFDIPKDASSDDKSASDDLTIPTPEEFGITIKADDFANQTPIFQTEETQPQEKDGSMFKKMFGPKKEKAKIAESMKKDAAFPQIPPPTDLNFASGMNDAGLSSLKPFEESGLDSIKAISLPQNTGIPDIKEEKLPAEKSKVSIPEKAKKDDVGEDITKNHETVKKSGFRLNDNEKLKQKTDAILKELVLYKNEIEEASKKIAEIEKVLRPARGKAKTGVKLKKRKQIKKSGNRRKAGKK